MAEVLLSQRRFGEAIPLLDEAERTARASGAAWIIPFVRLQQGRAAIGVGQHDRGIAELEGLLAEQLAAGESMDRPETAVYLGEALLGAGRPQDALEVLASLVDTAPLAAQRVAAGAARIRGRALAELGDVGGSGEAFSAGLRVAREAGDAYEEALLLEEISGSKRRAGIPPDPADDDRQSTLYDLLGIVSPAVAF